MRKVPQLPRFVTRRLKKKSDKMKDPDMKTRLLATHAYFTQPSVPVVKIAAIHNVHPSSIYRWARRFYYDGVDALVDQRTTQPVSYKRLFVQRMLPNLIQMGPALFGFPLSQWTSRSLADALWQLYTIVYSPSQIRRILKSLNFVWRRARPMPKVVPGRDQKLRQLKSELEALPETTELLFCDEVDVHLNPKVGFGWMPKARQRKIPTPGTNKKGFLIGAVSARSGKLHFQQVEKKTAQAFADFLAYVVGEYPEGTPIVIVLDNAKIHKAKLIKAWLEQHPLVTLEFLPGYSPCANCIEQIWRTTKMAVVYNHQCKTIDSLMRRFIRFLRKHGPFRYQAPWLPLKLAPLAPLNEDKTNENNMLLVDAVS